MRNTSHLLTPCIFVLLCACTPDSNNIGETLTTGDETGASTSEQSDGTTDDATDGVTDATTAAASTGTTAVESTGAVDTTTAETTSQTSGDETTLYETSNGDTTEGDTTSDTTGTGGTTDDTGGETGGDAFPCGKMACDADTQYCSVFVPGVMDAEILYSCAQIPARCNDTPSCACLPDGEAPPCQCAEDEGFTVTCYGA
jgi:hypothetical protein